VVGIPFCEGVKKLIRHEYQKIPSYYYSDFNNLSLEGSQLVTSTCDWLGQKRVYKAARSGHLIKCPKWYPVAVGMILSEQSDMRLLGPQKLTYEMSMDSAEAIWDGKGKTPNQVEYDTIIILWRHRMLPYFLSPQTSLSRRILSPG